MLQRMYTVKNLAIVLLVGLLIRILSFLWVVNLPQNGDLLRYADWGKISFLKGLDQTYNKRAITFGGEANNQPPGSLYPISLSYLAHLKASILVQRVQNTSDQEANVTNQKVLYLFMRLPSIFAEIILTIVIFRFIRKQKGQHALLASSLLYLNPVLIYNSTFWGQMDAINNLFFIGAVILIASDMHIRSASSLAISIMIKLSVLPLLPLYIIEYFKKNPSLKTIATSIGLALLIATLLTLPISKQPVSWLLQFLSNSAGGELQRITSEAFNFWYSIFSFPQSLKIIPQESALILGVPLSVIGYLLYLALLAPLAFTMIKEKKMTTEKKFILYALLALISFLFLPKMHERYLYPFFPLISIALGFSKKWLWFFISISLIHFMNLFISWDPGYINFIPYSLIENDWFKWGLSVALLGVFLALYKKALKLKIDSQK